MRHAISLFVCIATIFSGVSYAAPQLEEKFNTKGNPKAQGIWLTVRYPSGWVAKDGERPNIVKKFVHNSGQITQMLMLQVNDLPKDAAAAAPNLTEKDWAGALAGIGDNAKVYGVKKIRHEGQPAFVGDVSLTEERVGLNLYQRQRLMTVFYKDKMIFLWCGTTSLTSNQTMVDQIQSENVTSLCYQYFNSLVLMDRY